MLFSPDERRFAAAFIRYRRECQPDWTSCEGLTECLVGAGVRRASTKSSIAVSTPTARISELVLLTIATGPGMEHLIHIDLVFEGDAQSSCGPTRIDCRLDDFGAAGALPR